MAGVQIGDTVLYVDSVGGYRNAIVTNTFGGYGPEGQPSVNLVTTHKDESNSDPYGRQIERFTSVVHLSNQQAPGSYWKEQ